MSSNDFYAQINQWAAQELKTRWLKGMLPSLISPGDDNQILGMDGTVAAWQSASALGLATAADLAAHLADASAAHAGSAISNTPAGNIAATDVQAAINELDSEKATTGSVTTVQSNLDAHIADTTNVHDHGSLGGLGDDDHTQYHNDTRGDARYLKLSASTQTITGTELILDGSGTDNGVTRIVVKAHTTDDATVAFLDGTTHRWSAGLRSSDNAWVVHNTVAGVFALEIDPTSSIVEFEERPTHDGVQLVGKADFNAEGDILLATANDTPAVFNVGTTKGNILRVDPADSGNLASVLGDATGHDSVVRGLSGNTLVCSNGNPMTADFAATLADGMVIFSHVYLPYDETIDGIMWIQRTLGSTTGDNNNKVGLYTSDGTTLSRVAQSTTDSNLWDVAAGQQIKAFSSSYAATAGHYWIALLSNWSAVVTAPQLAGWAIGASGAGFNAGCGTEKRVAKLTGQTDLPSSPTWAGMSAMSDGGVWCGAYT